MKRFLLGVGCAVAMMAGSASAVTLRVPNISLRPGDANMPVEVVFDDAAADNEHLFAYTVGLKIVPVGGAVPGAVTFSAPWAALTETNPPVFPGAAPTVIKGEAGEVQAARDISGDENIDNGEGLIRVFLNASQLALGGGTYTIALDPDAVSLGSTDPAFADGIPFQLSNGTVTIIPEPAALSLLGVAGLLALRRRRTA